MQEVLQIQVDDLVELLLLAEDASRKVQQLVWYLLGRDPLTNGHLAELRHLATDAGIEVGSKHWALSASTLNRQVDRLLRSDGRQWKSVAEFLDPKGELGVDYAGLQAVLEARIVRSDGNVPRMRRLQRRLVREEG